MGPRRWRNARWSEDDGTRIIDERCDEYESEWRALRAPRIGDYLHGLDAETQCTLWRELVLLDRELREGRGETPTLADYRESCPDPMLLLDPSTGPIDFNGDQTNGTLAPDLTRGLAAEFGPAAERRIADWIADRDGPAPEAPPNTTASNERVTGPADPARTLGPPADGADYDVDGLAEARPGAVFGDYELIERLGIGGMGVVFKARQKRLNRTVALKMLGAGCLADEWSIRLFRGEARAVAALDHPHIVPILDSGEHRGILFYSMKLVEGDNLQKCLGRFRDDPTATARLVAKVARAISHAHRRGVLHRDLKPSNILVDAQGEPHVIDFGLASRLEGAGGSSAMAPRAGTPSFLSPEVARGDPDAITTAVDVYGLGAVLYTLLTGEPPFAGGSNEQVIRDVAHRPPPRPRDRNPRVDRDLEIICLKCLGKEAKERYPSARELADDLERWLDGRPILARPSSMPERAWKAARRHPAVSSLIGLLAITLIAGIGGIVWNWRAALAAREAMHGAMVVAQVNEGKALASEDQARHLAYAAMMNLAQRDWHDANVAQVLRRLDEARPPEGKTDLRGFEWYYLNHLARSQARTLAGHTAVVAGVAYNPDGRRVASASWDRTIKIRDAATGALIRTLTANQEVWAVAFHPDGTRLASAGVQGELILWDAGTGQPIRKLLGHDPASTIDHVAFSGDGKILASASWDGTIKLWEVDAGKLIHSLADHPAKATKDRIAFSLDGKTLVAVGGDRPTVRLWDIATGRIDRTLEPDETEPFICLAISPDGKRFAAGARPGRIHLWDAATGTVAHILEDTYNPHIILSLAFSRDGKTLASGGFTGQVVLWDAATGRRVRTLQGHTSAICDIASSPDGVHLATACWDGSVKLWDTSRDQEARRLLIRDVPRTVAFGPDGSYLVSAGQEGTITVWDRTTGQPVRPLRGHTGLVRSVTISPDGRRAASAGEDRTVRVWEVATGAEIHTLRGHTGAVNEVTFSPDGKMLASASHDRTVKLWDADTGQELRTLSRHVGAVWSVAFGPDGRMLASGGEDGFLALWDPTDGRRLHMIQASPDQILSIAISPDGQWLALGDVESTIKIWHIASRKEVQILRGHARAVNKLVFTPDGRRLVSASDDRTVRIWNPADGRELLVLRAHAGGVRGLAISPDGARIGTAGNDRIIKLWEADTGRPPLEGP